MIAPLNPKSHRRSLTSFTQETLPTNVDETTTSSRYGRYSARRNTEDDCKSFSYYSPKPNMPSNQQRVRPHNSIGTHKASRSCLPTDNTSLNRSISKNKSNSQERETKITDTDTSPCKRGVFPSRQETCTNSARTNRSKLNTEVSKNNSKSPRKVSEYAIKRMEDQKKLKSQGLKLGSEGLESLLHRKGLENHVKILQNRLNKLKQEEAAMAKKIKETSEKTEKILSSKRRHQEDLQKKELRAKKKEEDLNRKRAEIGRERQELREGLRKSSLNNFKDKHETACATKMDKEYHKMKKEEIMKQREERNKEIILKINGDSNLSMTLRQGMVSDRKSDATQKYVERILKDKMMADQLAQQCKELEDMEHQMLEKLSQTYNLHKTKIMELQKAFTVKVKVGEEV